MAFLNGDPLILDSFETVLPASHVMAVYSITWAGTFTPGNRVKLTDFAGYVKFHSVCSRTGYSDHVEFDPPLQMEGLAIPIFEDGVLHVHMRRLK